jgi:hypothetical protein
MFAGREANGQPHFSVRGGTLLTSPDLRRPSCRPIMVDIQWSEI